MSKIIKKETNEIAAMPDYLSDVKSIQGLDELAPGSFTIPRLSLLQTTSKDVKRKEAVEGTFQNALTKVSYGTSIELVFLKVTNGAVNMTMDEGLKCKSENGVTNTMNGGKCSECWLNSYYRDWSNGKKPECSETYDFIAVTRASLMSSAPEILVVSFMKTSIKMAKDKIISRARALNKPLYAQPYLFGTEYVSHPKSDYYGWTISYPGWLTHDEFIMASKLYDAVSTKEYAVQSHDHETPASKTDVVDVTDF